MGQNEAVKELPVDVTGWCLVVEEMFLLTTNKKYETRKLWDIWWQVAKSFLFCLTEGTRSSTSELWACSLRWEGTTLGPFPLCYLEKLRKCSGWSCETHCPSPHPLTSGLRLLWDTWQYWAVSQRWGHVDQSDLQLGFHTGIPTAWCILRKVFLRKRVIIIFHSPY